MKRLLEPIGTGRRLPGTQTHTVDGHDLCRVHVPPSAFPVEAQVKIAKGGQMVKNTAFCVRIGNGARETTDPTEKKK